MTCRVFGPPVRTAGEDGAEGLGHCELCFTAATQEEIAACEMAVPHASRAKLLDEIGGERRDGGRVCADADDLGQRAA